MFMGDFQYRKSAGFVVFSRFSAGCMEIIDIRDRYIFTQRLLLISLYKEQLKGWGV